MLLGEPETSWPPGRTHLQFWFCLAVIAFNEVVQYVASCNFVGTIPFLQENCEPPGAFLLFDRSHDLFCLEKSQKEVKKGLRRYKKSVLKSFYQNQI